MNIKTVPGTIFALAFMLFASCEARIEGAMAADGSASLTVNTSLFSRTAALIQNLFIAAGQEGQALDGPAIAGSMAGAPGLASVEFRNSSSAALSGQIRISQVSEFLSAAGGKGFISFERRGTGGRCEINIDRNNGHTILAMLSPQINDYLNALMAPVVTEETINKDEYLVLISTFYNRSIADEIARSTIRASIDFPGQVTSVTGGSFSARRAILNINLIDLLVLEKPLRYEVIWN